MFEHLSKHQDNLPKTPEKALIKPKSFFENVVDVGKSFKTASDKFDNIVASGFKNFLSKGADTIKKLNNKVQNTAELKAYALDKVANTIILEFLEGWNEDKIKGGNLVREAEWSFDDAESKRRNEENKARLAKILAKDVAHREKMGRYFASQDALAEEIQKRRGIQRNVA